MGGKTHVISLPSQWIKRYKVQKGEELEVEERDNSVLVTTNNTFEVGSCEINVAETNRMLGRTIGALYKAGYNDAKVIYETPEQLKTIENTLRKTCIGFEITNSGNNFVQISSLTKTVPEEFDNSLKRLFFTLEIMNQDLIKAIKAKDEQLLIEVINKDDQVNKLADLCRRILNKGDIKTISNPNVVYYVVEQLERIGDVYKKIAKRNIICNESDLKNFETINELFIDFRKLYYNFNFKQLESFGKSFDSLKEKIENDNNNSFQLYQEILIETIFDMNGGLITLRL